MPLVMVLAGEARGDWLIRRYVGVSKVLKSLERSTISQRRCSPCPYALREGETQFKWHHSSGALHAIHQCLMKISHEWALPSSINLNLLP